MSILAISFQNDIHARAITWGLNESGIKAAIVDVSRFPTNSILTFDPIHGSNATMRLSTCGDQNEEIALETVRAVWCRRFSSNPQYFDLSGVHEDDLNDTASEVQTFIDNWWGIVREILGSSVPWLNPVPAIANAKNKAYQLRIAHSVGFRVPTTIIGNSADAVREFCRKNGGEIIMKPFFQRTWKEGNHEYQQPTYLINSKHLHDDIAVKLCPAIYQEPIAKAFELRVLVLGDHFIAAKLNSQEHAHSQVDWRLDVYKRTMTIEPFALNVETKEKILAFMKRMNLKCGSIDLIVTPNNDIVFLEINEQGQFLFLEQQNPDIQVMSSVCQFFAKEAGVVTSSDFPSFSDYYNSADRLLLRKQQQEMGDSHVECPIKYTFQ